MASQPISAELRGGAQSFRRRNAKLSSDDFDAVSRGGSLYQRVGKEEDVCEYGEGVDVGDDVN